MDHWLEKLVVLFLWAAGAILAGILAFLVFYLVDSVGREEKIGLAIIKSHSFCDSYYLTTYQSVGTMQIPVTTYYPETYSLLLKLDEKSDWVPTSREFYSLSQDGETLNVKYQKGRISNKIYITKFWK